MTVDAKSAVPPELKGRILGSLLKTLLLQRPSNIQVYPPYRVDPKAERTFPPVVSGQKKKGPQSDDTSGGASYIATISHDRFESKGSVE